MLYEITIDCRIANKEYKKGDVVTIEEVGQYFTSVMKPINDAPKAKAEKVEPVEANIEPTPADEEKAEPKKANAKPKKK